MRKTFYRRWLCLFKRIDIAPPAMEFEINKLYFDTLLNRKMKKIFLPTLTLNFVLFAGLTAALSKKSKDIILISKELEVSIGHGEAAAGVRKWTIDV